MISRKNGIEQVLKFGEIGLTIATKVLLNRPLFLMALLIVAAYSGLLNFNAKAMSGLIPAYERFGDFFSTGMDFDSQVGQQIFTFPIWGYGILFFFTESKTTLIIMQLLFSTAVIMGIDYALEKLEWKKISRILFRFLICTAWIWFYFHTILWPYSWGANLLLVSLFSMILYLQNGHHLGYILASGIAFGLMLNFRSDYFYFAIGMIIVLLALNLLKLIKYHLWHLGVWVGLVLLLLVPWGWFSYQKTGHFLLKSTNGGHVLFISLGQLPENKWGITPLDADPKMRRLVDEKLGQGISTLSYTADTFLTAKWLQLIGKDPGEFMAKCRHNINELIKQPYYNGGIFQKSEGYADTYIVNSLDSTVQQLADNRTYDIQNVAAVSGRSYKLFLFHTEIFRWLLLGLLLFIILNWKKALKDPFFVVMLLIAAYQVALVILAYFMIAYNSNLLVVYSLLAIYFFVERVNWAGFWQFGKKKLRPALSRYWPQN